MSVKLLPCPFCGSDDVDLEAGEDVRHWAAVRCNYCGTLGPCIATDHKAAMTLWNVRNVTDVLPSAQKTL